MNPNDIGTEALKAAKEIAKVTGQGLEIVKDSGAFVSLFIGGFFGARIRDNRGQIEIPAMGKAG